MNWPRWTPCHWIRNLIHRQSLDDDMSKFHGDMRNNQQIIQSSQRRLKRASEEGIRTRQELDESHNRLKTNLEDMAVKLKRLKEGRME